MKLFKKLAVNIHSRVEVLADHLENKEALSTAYIREYERITARAKVKTSQVDGEVARLKKEEVRLRAQSEIWAERARKVYSTDETKALACVGRMTQIQAAHVQVKKELKETQDLRQKMAADVDQIMKKLDELKRRHRNLAGRQVCAEAVSTLHSADGGIEDDIDHLFSRWETDIVAREIHSHASPVTGDCLAEEFDAAEQQEALRQTLEELIASPARGKEVQP